MFALWFYCLKMRKQMQQREGSGDDDGHGEGEGWARVKVRARVLTCNGTSTPKHIQKILLGPPMPITSTFRTKGGAGFSAQPVAW